MIIEESDSLAHEGVIRRSGRYPWGSGGNPEQRNRSFLGYVDQLKKQGISETEIAKGMGMTTTQLRAEKSIAKNALKQAQISTAQKLKDKNWSNVAIGEHMGLNESSVRALLQPSAKDNNDKLLTTASLLKSRITKDQYLDIGLGTENHLNISQNQLKTAVAVLEKEGYKTHYIKVQQLGTGKDTTIKVLAPPGVDYGEVSRNRDRIKPIVQVAQTDDHGRSYFGIDTPKILNSRRVEVRYGDDGGTEMDGVIQLRREVKDTTLGKSQYAQVRIQVDKTHYLKGMAMYTDDLPDGIDVRFNTSKTRADIQKDVMAGKAPNVKLGAMKELKKNMDGTYDSDNPFGAVIKPGGQRGVLNIVNEEGDWGKWSKSLSSQMLSKQSPALAKQQLDLKLKQQLEEYDDISRLTNPSVRKKLLESFADGADSSAVHLKAAALPRQATHAILPINSVKETEVYAPNYRNGESVVLIRYPHGGKFEIPELTVNNRNKEAKSVMGNATDAIGIHSKVAERLSGADFDGDTVLVIPNNSGRVKTMPALESLKGFDPRREYPYYEGMKVVSADGKQHKMGDVSNLITDMTIKGANPNEVARAVKHSMVIIDAEKHKLDYRRSYQEQGIAELKRLYQSDAKSGASTLISRASSEVRVNDRKPRSAGKGGAIDPETGKKVFEETGVSYVDKSGKTVVKSIKSTKAAETDDLFTLTSKPSTVIENIYATHGNKLKALANSARKAALETQPIPYSPSAKKAFEKEVSTLNAKLNIAVSNKPLERHAQLIANAQVSAKRQANPDMTAAELKKIKGMALQETRARIGARKEKVEITPNEWRAIQAGAISKTKLDSILNNADLDEVKQHAMPREALVMTAAKQNHAKALLASGYTQAEVADQLGVPLGTLKSSIGEGE